MGRHRRRTPPETSCALIYRARITPSKPLCSRSASTRTVMDALIFVGSPRSPSCPRMAKAGPLRRRKPPARRPSLSSAFCAASRPRPGGAPIRRKNEKRRLKTTDVASIQTRRGRRARGVPFWRAQRLTPGPDDLPYDLQSAPATLKRVTFFVTSDPAATARTGSRSLSSNKNY